MGCERHAACTRCPHSGIWHPAAYPGWCFGIVRVYLDSQSGPPRPVWVPCNCPGYQPKGLAIMTPQAGEQPAQALAGDITQAVEAVDQVAASHGTNLAADTAAATDVIHAANTAYSNLHGTLHTAYTLYQDAVRAAHEEYSKAMAALHGKVTAAAADAGKPGD